MLVLFSMVANAKTAKLLSIKKMNRIIITHCPLVTNKDEVFAMAKNDEELIDAIKKHSKKQSNEGVETFERKENIIVTEKGYYGAFWESDLLHA